jgi:hypothetical protein
MKLFYNALNALISVFSAHPYKSIAVVAGGVIAILAVIDGINALRRFRSDKKEGRKREEERAYISKTSYSDLLKQMLELHKSVLGADKVSALAIETTNELADKITRTLDLLTNLTFRVQALEKYMEAEITAKSLMAIKIKEAEEDLAELEEAMKSEEELPLDDIVSKPDDSPEVIQLDETGDIPEDDVDEELDAAFNESLDTIEQELDADILKVIGAEPAPRRKKSKKAKKSTKKLKKARRRKR